METRREFLKEAGIGLGAFALAMASGGKVESKGDYFVFDPNNARGIKVYGGGFSSSIEDLAVIDYTTVKERTPEYQKIENENIKLGTGSFTTYNGLANERTDKWIREYCSTASHDLVIEKGSVPYGAFREVPDAYEGMGFGDILDNLDVSSDVVQ
jgi:hypothetical protein